MGRLNRNTYAKNLTESGIRLAQASMEDAIGFLARPCAEALKAKEAAGARARANLNDQSAQVAFAKADAKHARLQSMVDAIRGALETEV